MRGILTTLALATVGFSAASTQAALVLDFKPVPADPNIPELHWSGTALTPAAGSVGNADGNLPLSAQSPGGFQVGFPYTVVGVPGSQANANGSTTFFDVSLTLIGVGAFGGAQAIGSAVVQNLTPGLFAFASTDPDGAGPLLPTVLLSGQIGSPVITGVPGGAGSFLSGNVTYTGGLLLPILASHNYANTGSLSFTLNNVPALTGVGPLPAFDSDSTGQMDANLVPEPASFGLLAVASLAAGARRRSRKA